VAHLCPGQIAKPEIKEEKQAMRVSVLVAAALFTATLPCRAQQPTPLADLLIEAQKDNPEILAAQKEWAAATYQRPQVTALPDPQFTLQEFSVGSPRPGAGLSNNSFAYVGVGASQELPYPGKRRLKGRVADGAAAEQLSRVDVMRAKVAEELKSSYLRLSYLQYTLSLLNASRSTLSEIIETQLARYSSGQGSQADILKAQLERTKLLREVTMHHEEMAQVQADLKHAVSRPQTSPDIVADELMVSAIVPAIENLLHVTEQKNPTLIVDARTIAKESSAVAATRLAGKPDFSLGYMYQRTGLDFPAYYMASVTLTLPRKQRVAAERSEASERLAAAMLMRDADLQQQAAEVRKQYAAVVSTNEELKEYRDGILPQADTAYNSTLAALRSNRQTLDAVLTSIAEILQLKREYAQALLDHEMALVRLETLTGEVLR
jgi:outer membrane protein, heavy metal efflux system